jgi:KDO2-lipid IV(A) lauroyltransferase
MSKAVVSMVYPFLKDDRRGLAYNLSLAFGRAPTDPFIRQTVRRIFYNYGQYMIDFFIMPQLALPKIQRFLNNIYGEEHLIKALHAGRGAILLSAHIGNWEFGGTIMRLADYSLAVVALPHNTVATNSLVNRLRRGMGIKIFEVDGSSPFAGIDIFRHLRRNGVVAMIGDKDFFGSGRPTRFFGQLVNFPIGPVTLALNSGAALIPAFVLQDSDGRYFGVLEAEIPLETTNSREETIDINMAKVARIFEKYIRKYPDQWYCPDPITRPAVKEVRP